jgi:hypothetical protein
MAVAASCVFQPAGQIELFLPIKQRNGAHLAQVEAERIIRGLPGFFLGSFMHAAIIIIAKVKFRRRAVRRNEGRSRWS